MFLRNFRMYLIFLQKVAEKEKSRVYEQYKRQDHPMANTDIFYSIMYNYIYCSYTRLFLLYTASPNRLI